MPDYSVRRALPGLLERGKDSVLTLPVEYAGEAVHPSSGTFVLYDVSGAEVFQGPVSIPGGAGVPSVTVTGSSTAGQVLTDQYQEVWNLIIDGETYTFRLDAMLVRYKAPNVVGQTDLKTRFPDLDDHRPPEWDSYQPTIDEAWISVQADLIGLGNRPNLIVDSWKLRKVVITLSLYYIFSYFQTKTSGDDRWKEAATQTREEYNQEWKKLSFKYDTTDAGPGGLGSDVRKAAPVIFLSSSPRAQGIY